MDNSRVLRASVLDEKCLPEARHTGSRSPRATGSAKLLQLVRLRPVEQFDVSRRSPPQMNFYRLQAGTQVSRDHPYRLISAAKPGRTKLLTIPGGSVMTGSPQVVERDAMTLDEGVARFCASSWYITRNDPASPLAVAIGRLRSEY